MRWLFPHRAGIGNRFFYLFVGPLNYPEIPAAFALAVSGFSAEGLFLFSAACATRIFCSLCFETIRLSSVRTWVKYFWTIPFWDLSQFYFFLYGFFKKEATYNGRTFRFVDNLYLEEVFPKKS
jgi:hypothetical protein